MRRDQWTRSRPQRTGPHTERGLGSGTDAAHVQHNTTYEPGQGDLENGMGHNRDLATWSTVGAHKGPNPTIVERV